MGQRVVDQQYNDRWAARAQDLMDWGSEDDDMYGSGDEENILPRETDIVPHGLRP